MHALAAAVRLAAHLNLLQRTPVSVEVAARSVVADDPAHHVVDTEGVLGLDRSAAAELDAGLAAATVLAPGPWVLALPRPGAPGLLRGPKELTAAAIEAGAAVVAAGGLCAFVPWSVGNAVQWEVFAAAPPAVPPGRYEVERALSETVLTAGRALTEIGGAAGERPDPPTALLPQGYPARTRLAADRAAGLLLAAEAGIEAADRAWSVHAVEVRSRELRALRDAAADALAAAVWLPPS
ncbi:hypothetical protein ACF3NT_02250 [Naumannella halotolerans]|uniref:Uncharacterized protein n=1 Tax=Naumannella halotolerans TaxID=993414 RepID=A0A4R7J6L8_9ACTN|nr:hypothetical protein [Naumannella halotolerans]TDT32884.1 hypothetical protein CLV29_0474 [Naumannella halotolerans]